MKMSIFFISYVMYYMTVIYSKTICFQINYTNYICIYVRSYDNINRYSIKITQALISEYTRGTSDFKEIMIYEFEYLIYTYKEVQCYIQVVVVVTERRTVLEMCVK